MHIRNERVWNRRFMSLWKCSADAAARMPTKKEGNLHSLEQSHSSWFCISMQMLHSCRRSALLILHSFSNELWCEIFHYYTFSLLLWECMHVKIEMLESFKFFQIHSRSCFNSLRCACIWEMWKNMKILFSTKQFVVVAHYFKWVDGDVMPAISSWLVTMSEWARANLASEKLKCWKNLWKFTVTTSSAHIRNL